MTPSWPCQGSHGRLSLKFRAVCRDLPPTDLLELADRGPTYSPVRRGVVVNCGANAQDRSSPRGTMTKICALGHALPDGLRKCPQCGFGPLPPPQGPTSLGAGDAGMTSAAAAAPATEVGHACPSQQATTLGQAFCGVCGVPIPASASVALPDPPLRQRVGRDRSRPAHV